MDQHRDEYRNMRKNCWPLTMPGISNNFKETRDMGALALFCLTVHLVDLVYPTMTSLLDAPSCKVTFLMYNLHQCVHILLSFVLRLTDRILPA